MDKKKKLDNKETDCLIMPTVKTLGKLKLKHLSLAGIEFYKENDMLEKINYGILSDKLLDEKFREKFWKITFQCELPEPVDMQLTAVMIGVKEYLGEFARLL